MSEAMSKLYINGKLVDANFNVTRIWHSPADIRPTRTPEQVHADGECRSLPTYFCPYCAREALNGVDWGNPWK